VIGRDDLFFWNYFYFSCGSNDFLIAALEMDVAPAGSLVPFYSRV
jgi:hypothetical protein